MGQRRRLVVAALRASYNDSWQRLLHGGASAQVTLLTACHGFSVISGSRDFPSRPREVCLRLPSSLCVAETTFFNRLSRDIWAVRFPISILAVTGPIGNSWGTQRAGRGCREKPAARTGEREESAKGTWRGEQGSARKAPGTGSMRELWGMGMV